MHNVSIDSFDRAILGALQADGSLTNAALADIVNLSPSQCSRRRSALEDVGLIEGYSARINVGKLGFGLRAMIRINLRNHGQGVGEDFARFIEGRPEIRTAFSVSGDADYVLDIRVRDLDAFASFIHESLLPHPLVSQVRSEIVLKTLTDKSGVDLN